MKSGILTLLLIISLVLLCPFDMLGYHLGPFIFGISFFFVNKKLLKIKLVIGLLLSIILSYLAFIIGFFGIFGISKIEDVIIEYLNFKSINDEVSIIFSGLLASLSLFLLYTKIYSIQNIKKGFQTMLFSYLLVPILVYFIPSLFRDILMFNFFEIYTIIWLVIVSFFLSFCFNQFKVVENLSAAK